MKRTSTLRQFLSWNTSQTKRPSPGFRNTIDNVRSRFGDTASALIHQYGTATTAKGLILAQKTEPFLVAIKSRNISPEDKQKAVSAIIVATAVGLSVYNNRQEIKEIIAYRAINSTLEKVQLNTSAGPQSAKQVIYNKLTQYCSYCSETSLAQDPARALAMVVASAPPEKLFAEVEFLPDGHGGAQTVVDAVSKSPNAEYALKVLQFSDSLEHMAVNTLESGTFGSEGVTFAQTYRRVDEAIAAQAP